MIVTVDEQQRVPLPSPVRPGDVFDLKQTGEARFTLTPVDQPVAGVRLERKNGYLVAVTQHSITQEAARGALDESP